MKTHCNQKTFYFQTENPRKIVAHFNGGNITSDAGGLLLQQAERITGIISRFAKYGFRCLKAIRIESFLSRCMQISDNFVRRRCDVESLSAVANRFSE